jgi:hypothetical protein
MGMIITKQAHLGPGHRLYSPPQPDHKILAMIDRSMTLRRSHTSDSQQYDSEHRDCILLAKGKLQPTSLIISIGRQASRRGAICCSKASKDRASWNSTGKLESGDRIVRFAPIFHPLKVQATQKSFFGDRSVSSTDPTSNTSWFS